MASCKKLWKIDRRTKLSVHGWMREYEQEVKSLNIPNSIIEICILFCRMDEIFDRYNKKAIKLSKDKKRIKLKKATQQLVRAYGINEISFDGGKYRWDINISGAGHWYIGICTCNKIYKALSSIRCNYYALCYKGFTCWKDICTSFKTWGRIM